MLKFCAKFKLNIAKRTNILLGQAKKKWFSHLMLSVNLTPFKLSNVGCLETSFLSWFWLIFEHSLKSGRSGGKTRGLAVKSIPSNEHTVLFRFRQCWPFLSFHWLLCLSALPSLTLVLLALQEYWVVPQQIWRTLVLRSHDLPHQTMLLLTLWDMLKLPALTRTPLLPGVKMSFFSCPFYFLIRQSSFFFSRFFTDLSYVERTSANFQDLIMVFKLGAETISKLLEMTKKRVEFC